MTAGAGGTADLLATATTILRQHEFAVSTESLQGVEQGWALAESELFVIAVATAPDLKGLRDVESVAAPELIGRLGANEALGGKRWDAYLVLICSEGADRPAEARTLADIEYDTHGVRRLVAVGVEPTSEDIRRVLRPFLPLPPPSPEGLAGAFEGLQEQLVLNGVADAEARRIVAAFQDRGDLSHV